MSANPDAFEYLRKSAYGHVQRHGNEVNALRQHCRDALDAWLRDEGTGSGLHPSEAESLVEDVSTWVGRHYRRPKRKALRRREERAAAAMVAPVFLEYAAEDGLKPSVRNAARIAGQSKSTMARHLRLQGIAPVRDGRIAALPTTARRLARILDNSFPTDGAWLVRLDHCVAKLWDDLDVLPEAMPRSTRSERRKKLPELLAAVTAAGIGFNVLVNGDAIAIRRGRRFHGMKDTAAWMEEEERVNGFRFLRSPETEGRRRQRFWDDPWVADVLAVMFSGAGWRTFPKAEELQPWLRLLRPLLDPRPLVAVIEAAIRGAMQDDFVLDLQSLCARVTDKEVRTAGYRLAGVMETIRHDAEWGWEPADYFADVDHELRFMAHLARTAPKSHAKLMYFRNVVLPKVGAEHADDPNPIYATMKRCRALPDEEKAGTWTAPTAKELAAFLPPKG
ncbi:hypothetical protein J2766_000239 [Agrobacterium tumefaciens]|uniref:Uncharacterized protein n=1 Tax=Agrobacterium tumefaciens TaxID=358 RepID=A0AAW8LTV3_AGRTU|nr:hypothetical protein [Agrobacterium tumefaciens]MBP2563680.1 hypothetical protein [Agrobacterium tumefaciens]MDR6702457.1 hypothetical protein [Agrobacterium tumefaciens]